MLPCLRSIMLALRACGAAGLAVLVAVTAGACVPDARLHRDETESRDDGAVGSRVQSDIIVEPWSGLVTSESGTKATFTVVLARQPTDAVAIALSSSDEDEGVVSPSSLTFTTENWHSPQTVTVFGADDDLADGPKSYVIRTSTASSADPTFAGVEPLDPEVTNIDDETAGVTIVAHEQLRTSESGLQAWFSVVLNKAPTADVSISLACDDPTEGVVTSDMLIFTSQNWRAPHWVGVEGVNDDLRDGAQPFHVVLSAPDSDDSAYRKLSKQQVDVINDDNDAAGFAVNAQGGFTTESGGQTVVQIALLSPPTADVRVSLESSNTAEGQIVGLSELTFTPINWQSWQSVIVQGVDDEIIDGDQPFVVTALPARSGDPSYANLDPADVRLFNRDDETPAFRVFPANLLTSENGNRASFWVTLGSPPTRNTTLDIVSSAPDEGTALPTALTFTQVNWNAPQRVTVTGKNDDLFDGNITYFVHVRARQAGSVAEYAQLTEQDVTLVNLDNDGPDVLVKAVTPPYTSEAGGTAVFEVTLAGRPNANVAIAFATSDASEGVVAPSSLAFTPDNYAAPQRVVVTGVDDSVEDGARPYRILISHATSEDGRYQGPRPPAVWLLNLDDDTAGLEISAITGAATESGGTARFTLALASRPSADVTIALASSNTREATVSPLALTFNASNWSVPQGVLIRGVDDEIADGDQPFRIAIAPASSADERYNGRSVLDPTLVNYDDDTPGYNLSGPTDLTCSEAGGEGTFGISLRSQPRADVTVRVSSTDLSEGTVSPAELTFTPADWQSPHLVAVAGVDDEALDGNQTFWVDLLPASSKDPMYNELDPPDVPATNFDNDGAGLDEGNTPVLVTPTNGVTDEAGGETTFTIVLNSAPVSDVLFPISSSDPTEGVPLVTAVIFTPHNWQTPQVVAVQGADDDIVDGDQHFSIVIDKATSTDARYQGVDPIDVQILNLDDD